MYDIATVILPVLGIVCIAAPILKTTSTVGVPGQIQTDVCFRKRVCNPPPSITRSQEQYLFIFGRSLRLQSVPTSFTNSGAFTTLNAA
jgi:hypothetical protein